jgi:polyhydroxyalkanoate synthase
MSETDTYHPFIPHRNKDRGPLPLFLSLLRSETAASPERSAAALAGLKAYQEAARPPARAPKPAIAGRPRDAARLWRQRAAGGVRALADQSALHPRSRARQFAAALAARQGVRPMLVDWGTPGPEDRDEDVTAHIESMLLPCSHAQASRRCWSAIAWAARWRWPRRAARKSRAGDHRRAVALRADMAISARPIAELWDQAQPPAMRLGWCRWRCSRPASGSSIPSRTIAKFERFARAETRQCRRPAPLSRSRIGPMPAPRSLLRPGRQMFDEFIPAICPGAAAGSVGGTVLPDSLLPDRAASPPPIASSPPPAPRDLPERPQSLALGHVGMIVGGRAPDGLGAAWRTG